MGVPGPIRVTISFSGRLFVILGAFLRHKLLIHTYIITKKNFLTLTHLQDNAFLVSGCIGFFFKSQRSLSIWLKRILNSALTGGIFTPLLERDRIIEGTQIVPAGLIDYYLSKGPHFVWRGRWYSIFLLESPTDNNSSTSVTAKISTKKIHQR